MTKILLDNKEIKISEELISTLISYQSKSGGSFFSLGLVAGLLRKKSKMIFYSAFPMATKSLLNEIKDTKIKVGQIDSLEDLETKQFSHVLLIKPGDEALFLKVMDSIEDLASRIIFAKNFELLKDTTIEKCLTHRRLFLSGDLEKSSYKQEILAHDFNSTVFFSSPGEDSKFKVPELKKYTGYMFSKEKTGVVSVKKN